MNLLNQTLQGFSVQISDLSVAVNTDIFESNVINITILLGGIIYLGSNALSSALDERQQKIVGSIQEAEERLNQAISPLSESEKQLAQAQLIVDSINADAKTTAQQVKSAILADGKTEIERLTSSAKAQIKTIESKVRKQISEYVVALALKRVTLQLEGKLNSDLQQQLIDRNISKLSD
jgi:F-type H+-transporting ATPase subunit b